MLKSVGYPSASDVGRTISSNYQIAKSNRELNEAQERATTGQLGKTYAANYTVAQDSQVRKIDNASLNKQIEGFDIISAHYDEIEKAYKSFEEVMVEYHARIKKYASSGSEDPSFQEFCKNSLKRIEQKLNGSPGSNAYYFAGVGGIQPVTSLSALARPPLGTNLDPALYSSYQQAPDLKDVNILGFKVNINARYDNPEISKMIHALTIGAQTPATSQEGSNDYLQLQRGMNLALESLEGIGEKFGNIGTVMVNIEKSKESDKEAINTNIIIIKEYDTEFFLTSLNYAQEIMNKLKIQASTSSNLSRMMMDAINSMHI